MRKQTASPWTPHPSCLYPPQNGSGKVSLVVRNVSDSHIFLKKGVPVVWVMSVSLGAAYRVVTRDGSCSRHGIPTRTHVSSSETGNIAGKLNLGQVGPLVPRGCGSGERASPGLS